MSDEVSNDPMDYLDIDELEGKTFEEQFVHIFEDKAFEYESFVDEKEGV